MRAHSIFTGSVLTALAATVATVLAPSPASADTVEATRYDVLEKSHVVEVRVDRGFATLVVQRKVANSGPKSDQATFRLSLPETAVATRLRTAGTTTKGETVWFEGELMEAEAAAKKYEELTGIGGYYPKDPALLSWRGQGSLALQVFPVPAQSTKVVEYTLKMPLTYEHGVYRVELPSMGTDAMSALLRVSSVHPEDSITVNDVVPAAGGGGAISVRAEKPVTIALQRVRPIIRGDSQHLCQVVAVDEEPSGHAGSLPQSRAAS